MLLFNISSGDRVFCEFTRIIQYDERNVISLGKDTPPSRKGVALVVRGNEHVRLRRNASRALAGLNASFKAA